jgi:hypothetical protein
MGAFVNTSIQTVAQTALANQNNAITAVRAAAGGGNAPPALSGSQKLPAAGTLLLLGIAALVLLH